MLRLQHTQALRSRAVRPEIHTHMRVVCGPKHTYVCVVARQREIFRTVVASRVVPRPWPQQAASFPLWRRQRSFAFVLPLVRLKIRLVCTNFRLESRWLFFRVAAVGADVVACAVVVAGFVFFVCAKSRVAAGRRASAGTRAEVFCLHFGAVRHFWPSALERRQQGRTQGCGILRPSVWFLRQWSPWGSFRVGRPLDHYLV